MTDTLSRIINEKRSHVASAKAARSLTDLEQAAHDATPPRGFKAALDATRAAGRHALIAEIKKASPSKGLIREDFDPPALASAYYAGGASCLSVLTDIPYFQGDDRYLAAARAATPLPVLRKDFMIDPWQVVEARALGADCILLIAAALSLETMRELEAAAFALGMDVLVEVHNAAEMEQALRLETRLLGINNRDLKSLDVDIRRSIELATLVPAGYTLVGESGISRAEDLDRLAGHGIVAFLVGESLMRQADVEAATRALLGEA